MAFGTHPGSTDLLMPLPGPEETWDPHLIHTHYFGFSVPDAQIGAFIYLRYQPAFPLSQGGVCIFQGTDNVEYTDMAYLDYEITMPWPVIDANSITTDNGLRIDFVETGELVLDGVTYPVDCFAPRDRSWRQIRVEKRGAVPVPPVGWSPMYFGPDLIFNQISFEPLDTDPAWRGLYEVGDRPSHHFAWVQRGEHTRAITAVRRDVLEYHPRIHLATRQEITAVDDRGETYRFHGEAIAAASLPAWPNVSFHDSVYRWEDEQGRVTHATYQEIWFAEYQRAMVRRNRDLART